MAVEHGSQIHIPRFHVAHQALEEADTAFSRGCIARLDRMFPRPDVREPSARFLRTLGCPDKYIPLVEQLNTPWKIQEYINQHFTYDHSNATRGFVGILETSTTLSVQSGTELIDQVIQNQFPNRRTA
jgi:hypothetical protein